MGSCLTESELHRYHAKEMSAAEAAGVCAHLEGCSSCAERSAKLVAGQKGLIQDLQKADLGLEADEPMGRDANDRNPENAQNETRSLPEISQDGTAPPRHEPAKSKDQPLDSAARRRLEQAATLPGDSSSAGGFVAPQSVGPVRLVRPIGSGGMSVVYLGWHELLKKDVAVKFLLAGAVEPGSEEFDRLLEGAGAAAAVQHPNLTTIYNADVVDGSPYVVMQYVAGPTLDDVLRTQGELELPATLAILEQVAGGLAALHERNILHRDIKPRNVLLDGEGNAYLTDFGLTLPKHHPEQSRVAGTPPYMAPELFEGVVSEKADVYALGILTFQLLCGQLPFSGDPEELAEQIRNEPLPLAELQASGVDQAVIEVIERTTRKDPVFRYKSARHFLAALREAVPDQEVWDEGRRNRTSLVTADSVDREGESDSGSSSSSLMELLKTQIAARRHDREQRARQQLKYAPDLPRPELPDDAVIVDLPCINCAHNLKYTPASKVCLECETPVGRSFDPTRLIFAEIKALSRIRLGLALSAVAWMILVVGLALALGLTATGTLDSGMLLKGSAWMMFAAFGLAGLMLSTTRVIPNAALWLTVLRWMSRVLGLGVVVLVLASRPWGVEPPMWLPQLVVVLAFAAVGLQHLCLAHVAQRGQHHWQQKLLRVLGISTIALAVAVNFMAGLETLAIVVGLGTAFLLPLGIPVAYLWYRSTLKSAIHATLAEHAIVLSCGDNLASVRERYFVDQHRTSPDKHRMRRLLVNRRTLGVATLCLLGLVWSRTTEPGRWLTVHARLHLVKAGWVSRGPGEFEALLREAVDWDERVLGQPSDATAQHAFNRGRTLYFDARCESAVPLFSFAVRLREQIHGDTAEETITAVDWLGSAYHRLNQAKAAVNCFRRVLEAREGIYAEDHWQVLETMNDLANALVDLGDDASAEKLILKAIRLQPQPPNRDDVTYAYSLRVLGKILIQQDQLPEAEQVLRQCLATSISALFAGHWRIGHARSLLGESLARQSRFEEAEPFLLEGYLEMNESFGAWKIRVRQAAERLVAFYEAWGKPEQAAEWRAKLEQPEAGPSPD